MAAASSPKIMIRRYVPNDHECLFTAIAYFAEGSRKRDAGKRLRKICANVIAADPNTYSEAVLGKPNEEYVGMLFCSPVKNQVSAPFI